jgi:hypothetical protein
MGQKYYGMAGLFEYSGAPLAIFLLLIFKIVYILFAGAAYILVGRRDYFIRAKSFPYFIGNEGDARAISGVLTCISFSVAIFWFLDLYGVNSGWPWYPLTWVFFLLLFIYMKFYYWRKTLEGKKNEESNCE